MQALISLALLLPRPQMGHRLEVYLSPEHAEEVIAISESFGIPAQIVGRIEACEQTELIIKSEFGEFRY